MSRTQDGDEEVRRKLTFWERAYGEIEKDAAKKNILKHYDTIVRRSSGVLKNDGVDGDQQDASDDSVDVLRPTEILTEVEDEAIAQPIFGNEQAMRAVAGSKLQEMQDKEWILRWKGKDVFKIREQVTRVVKFTQRFSGIIDKATSLEPHAGMAWSGICVLLPVSREPSFTIS
jgi:hypothetical protein